VNRDQLDALIAEALKPTPLTFEGAMTTSPRKYATECMNRLRDSILAVVPPEPSLEKISRVLAAEPPTDGDRQISLKAAIEALERVKQGAESTKAMAATVSDVDAHRRMTIVSQAMTNAIEILKTLAPEPPSAPAPAMED
jgi:hypothetical protein